MILTELGLNFRRVGDRWRCVEWPGLVMLRGGPYEVEAQDGAARAAAWDGLPQLDLDPIRL